MRLRLSSTPIILLLLSVYVLFVTRPGDVELREQLAASGNLQPWPLEIIQMVMTKTPFDKPFREFASSHIDDYGLFTVIWQQSKIRANQDFLLGILGRFVPVNKKFALSILAWSPDTDILLAIFLHFVAVFLYTFNRSVAFRMFELHIKRPWTIVLSSFKITSLWSFLIHAIFLATIGIDIRKSMNRSSHPHFVFWTTYCIIPSISILITRLVLDRFAATMGYNGALMALAAYGTISLPKMRISLFGMNMSWFGFFILEVLHYMSFNVDLRNVVSLQFDCFIVGVGVVFFYKLLHPTYVFSLDRVKAMTVEF